MSDTIPIIGLTYDGVDLQPADLSFYLEIERGFAEPPDVRGEDTVVPSRAGRTEGNRVNDTLSIELRGFVRGVPNPVSEADDRSSFAANRAAIRNLFRPSRARADLVAVAEDGSTWTVSARPMPGTIWTRRVPSFSEVSIEMQGYGDWAESAS